MTKATSILLETNVLIRMSIFSGADAVFDNIGKQLVGSHVPFICLQNLTEFWSVATRPWNVNGLSLTPEKAHNYVQSFRISFGLLSESHYVADIWQDLCRRVSGRRVHDMRLAATALANGVNTIATFNIEDFAKIDELNILELSV